MNLPPSTLAAISEDTLLITWHLEHGDLPSPSLAAKIGALSRSLLASSSLEILNVVPAYCTLMVQYDLLVTSFDEVSEKITDWLSVPHSVREVHGTSHTIPVCYDARVGPDLEALCQSRSLKTEQVIQLHTGTVFTVFAIGFQPGFAYLGHLPRELACPRQTSFRPRVAAGSVAIADQQTAIYPTSSPGGWNIIGRTPIVPVADQFTVGDTVQFFSIDYDEFIRVGGQL